LNCSGKNTRERERERKKGTWESLYLKTVPRTALPTTTQTTTSLLSLQSQDHSSPGKGPGQALLEKAAPPQPSVMKSTARLKVISHEACFVTVLSPSRGREMFVRMWVIEDGGER
jgi:hypothetical protein